MNQHNPDFKTRSRSRLGGMVYQIFSEDIGTFIEAKNHLVREMPKILKEWPYYMDRPDTINKKSEIHAWLIDNCDSEFHFPAPQFKGDRYQIYVVGVLFKDEADAMAFKLAWS